MSSITDTVESIDAISPSAHPKRLALASMIGTTLEYYDFTIYNTMAALVFSQLFFPSVDPMVGTILAFSTYAVGYLSRPLGGLFFGRLGDKIGRRAVLVITLDPHGTDDRHHRLAANLWLGRNSSHRYC